LGFFIFIEIAFDGVVFSIRSKRLHEVATADAFKNVLIKHFQSPQIANGYCLSNECCDVIHCR